MKVNMKKLIVAVALVSLVGTSLVACKRDKKPDSTDEIAVEENIPSKATFKDIKYFDKQYDDYLEDNEGYIVVREGGLLGYVDSDGKQITDIKYTNALAMSNGLARVAIEGKWGFIDNTGKEVIPLGLDGATDFVDGYAAYKQGNLWGVLSKDNKFITEPLYSWVGNESDGLIPVCKDGKYGYIDTSGVVVIPLEYDYAPMVYEDGVAVVAKGQYMSLITKEGKKLGDFVTIVPYIAKNGILKLTSKDLIHVALLDNGELKEGYIHKDNILAGKMDFEFYNEGYYGADEFSSGLIPFSDDNNKMGFKNSEGQPTIRAIYDTVKPFSDGFAWVKSDMSDSTSFMLLDDVGDTVLEDTFDFVGNFVKGKAFVAKNGKLGVLEVKK